jgi:16S rRNA (guanine(966)-N(2))-methyltransferase RsmD
MRVISGTAKGIELSSVPGDSTRPILDRVKTSLFDILRPQLSGVSFLDAFAGSGSVGIEALSNGAERCVLLDLERKAIQVIRSNLEKCGLQAKAEVRHTDAFLFLGSCKEQFDIIYIAPPQYQGLWEDALIKVSEKPELLKPPGLVVIQIDPSEESPLALSALKEVDRRKYGKTLLLFYKKQD